MQRHRTHITLNPKDNVSVVLSDIGPGEMLSDSLCARSAIPTCHKVALADIASGAPVVKYGEVIGEATAPIQAGEWVHRHNLRMPSQLTQCSMPPQRPIKFNGPTLEPGDLTFDGYQRSDGRAGTRNYLIVVATVSCANATARAIVDAARRDAGIGTLPGIDGVLPILHTQGCGMVVGSHGYRLLRRTLSGCLTHPNVAGALILGLGCEMNGARALSKMAGRHSAKKVRMLDIQSCGGSVPALDDALSALRKLAKAAVRCRRAPVSVSQLTVALQCGGSDAFSGISANPALGVAADGVVQAGGQVILSETPEIFGAEHLLNRRAETESIRTALVRRIAWWQDYAAMHGGTLDNNPAPGNHMGGLTTIVEKALGAVSKGGTSPLKDVVEYSCRSPQKGLVFMDSPGYDPVSVTGQIASGATVVVFTTGRGTPYGGFLAPVIKVASSSEAFLSMAANMDIDSGAILDGTKTIDQVGEDIFKAIVKTASGEKTRSESLFNGDDMFIPWQIGAVM